MYTSLSIYKMPEILYKCPTKEPFCRVFNDVYKYKISDL